MELLRRPPRYADLLLEWLCREELHEEIQGDLHQYYARLLREQDRWSGIKYWYHTFQFLRPYALKPIVKNSNFTSMMRLNFLVAYRNIMNHKFYAFINILGLALGLAVCMLIGTYIKHELSYDRHWENSDRLFRAVGELKFEDNYLELSATPAPMAASFEKDFPRILKAARFRDIGSRLVQVGDRFYQEPQMSYADPEVLELFNLELLDGSFDDALSDPAGAIIAASSAKRLFGSADPIGQRFEHAGTPYSVKAVYADLPDATHFHYTMMLSMESFNDPGRTVWLSNNYRTYFLLDTPEDYEAVSASFKDVYQRYFGPQIEAIAGASWDQFMASGSFVNYYLQPVEDIHLHSDLQYEIEANGNFQYILIFGAAGLFVLIIAAINFMNISTARSSTRAKEVGIKKVVGSPKSQLVYQFISESLLNSLLALVIAIGLFYLGLPTLNDLTNKTIVDPLFGELNLFPTVLIATVVVGLLAGVYPAFFLAGFAPLKVLKG
ncbi:MAG: ABC transporter permease, partial [Bacteroidota bacterium]